MAQALPTEVSVLLRGLTCQACCLSTAKLSCARQILLVLDTNQIFEAATWAERLTFLHVISIQNVHKKERGAIKSSLG